MPFSTDFDKSTFSFFRIVEDLYYFIFPKRAHQDFIRGKSIPWSVDAGVASVACINAADVHPEAVRAIFNTFVQHRLTSPKKTLPILAT